MLNKEVLTIFVVFLIVSFINSLGICLLNYDIGFDSQELLTWEYLSTTKLIIYQDYYYPYGILNSLKNQSQLFLVIHSVIIPVLFTSIFFFMKKIWKDSLFTYASFITFVLFIYLITGTGTFIRYGVILVTSLYYAFVFTNVRQVRLKTSFIIGLLNGIIFSLIYDQGIYSIITYIFCLFAFPIINFGISTLRTTRFYFSLLKQICWFTGGFLSIIWILFLYLVLSDSLVGFISNITTLGDIALYAKTPFLHSLRSPEGIYNLVIMLITIVFLIYKLIFNKVKVTLHLSTILVLFFILLLLEQKSIIRSIDVQLTFISFLLANILFYKWYLYLKKKNIGKIFVLAYYILFFLASISVFGLKQQVLQNSTFNIISFRDNILDPTISVKSCYNRNLQKIQNKYPQYGQVLSRLSNFSDFDGKIYSFPGNPIFYILLRQKLPYYSAVYQASPLYAQKRIINYIKDEKINYIIYDLNNLAIQDEVPNYIRVSILHSYIINNFIPVEKVSHFLILKEKNNNEDFFDSSIFNNTPKLKNYLLNVNLANIPKSEGIYKNKYLNTNYARRLFSASSIKEINKFLHINKTDSTNKLLVLYFKNENKEIKEMDVIIKSRKGVSTKIHFNSCEVPIPCIINLSHVPLLYDSHSYSIAPNKSLKIIKFELYDIKDNKYFW